MQKLKWFQMSKALPVKFCLVTDPALLKTYAKKIGYQIPPDLDHWYGCCVQTGAFSVIFVNVDKHKDEAAVIDTIIHESVHAFQGFIKFIGEDQVGTELEAYFIAYIASTCIKQLSKETVTCLT